LDPNITEPVNNESLFNVALSNGWKAHELSSLFKKMCTKEEPEQAKM
jgi:hypothetical protein